MRAIGVYSLNWLANDVFNWCHAEGIKLPSEKDIEIWLEPLKAFDWTRKSPIAAYGGMRGVQEAYKLLLAVLANGGKEKALLSLKEMRLKPSEIDSLLADAARVTKKS